MDVEWIRKICMSLPGVTEEIKWDNDLCFLVGSKMFCVTGLDKPSSLSFKVRDEEFVDLVSGTDFTPAPYLARAKWVSLAPDARVKRTELEDYIRQSYELIMKKLSARAKKELGIL